LPVAHDIEMLFCGLSNPNKVQEECLLNRIIKPNEDCEYGRKHDFSSIETVRDYQRNVPIVTYADLEPEISRMAKGENGILVSEPVRRFFATSGSTAAAKTIPVTSSFIADKSRAFGIYWGLLFDSHPDAELGKVVGNFSDSAGGSKVPGGFPLTSEGAYWNAVSSATQKRGRSPLPKCVSQIADSDSRYYVAARILLEEDVSLLMALNPSTLLLFFRKMNAFSEELITDVETGGLKSDLEVGSEVREYIAAKYTANPARANQLRNLKRSTGLALTAHEVWPTLKLVVSWRSPMQLPYLRLLEPHIGSIPQRDYLLMASEGVIAIPMEDHTSGGVLATPFHFYEFIREDEIESPNPQVLLASEIEVNQSYVVILSTSAGLYRYNIGDVVRVTGMKERTPVVEFSHRAGSTCSITGEKLTEEQVVQAMNTVVLQLGLQVEDFTLYPSFEGFPHYVLLVEPLGAPQTEALRALPRAFDLELAERNIEYSAKRQSDRLGPPELMIVKTGSYGARRRRRIDGGANDAQIKPTNLSRDANFFSQFGSVERINYV